MQTVHAKKLFLSLLLCVSTVAVSLDKSGNSASVPLPAQSSSPSVPAIVHNHYHAPESQPSPAKGWGSSISGFVFNHPMLIFTAVSTAASFTAYCWKTGALERLVKRNHTETTNQLNGLQAGQAKQGHQLNKVGKQVTGIANTQNTHGLALSSIKNSQDQISSQVLSAEEKNESLHSKTNNALNDFRHDTKRSFTKTGLALDKHNEAIREVADQAKTILSGLGTVQKEQANQKETLEKLLKSSTSTETSSKNAVEIANATMLELALLQSNIGKETANNETRHNDLRSEVVDLKKDIKDLTGLVKQCLAAMPQENYVRPLPIPFFMQSRSLLTYQAPAGSVHNQAMQEATAVVAAAMRT